MSTERLRQEAERFASQLTSLLNSTVTDHASLTARITPERQSALLRHGPPDSLRAETIPVPLRRVGHAHLLVSYDLRLDREGRHLAVHKSTVGLYMLEGLRKPLFRYEFERDKGRYSAAHLHVHGQSHALGRLYAGGGRDASAQLHDLRLPVGGVRFRPSVEDVLELLLQYEFVSPKPGAMAVIEEEREKFRQIQLKAGVRRDPATALRGLRRPGGCPKRRSSVCTREQSADSEQRRLCCLGMGSQKRVRDVCGAVKQPVKSGALSSG